MATVSVRYIVHDVEAAIGFYTRYLGFSVQIHPNDMFAMLTRGDLRLVLSVPGGGPGGGQADAGRHPARARRLEPVRGRGPRPGRHRRRAAGATASGSATTW